MGPDGPGPQRAGGGTLQSLIARQGGGRARIRDVQPGVDDRLDARQGRAGLASRLLDDVGNDLAQPEIGDFAHEVGPTDDPQQLIIVDD